MDHIKLYDTLNKLKKEQLDKKKNGKSVNIAAIVTSVIALVLVVAFSWLAWKKSKQLASLLHERDKQAEMKKQASINAQLADESTVIVESLQKVEDAEIHIEMLDAKIKEVRDTRDEFHNLIEGVTSWEDVDRIVVRTP